MSISSRQIFKNTSVLMVSQVVTWGLTLILTLFLPRYLGVENMGKLQLTSSLWTIVVMFAAFGMDTYLTREIAKDYQRLNRLLSQSIIVRLTFFAIGTLLLILYVNLSKYTVETMQVLVILGISNLAMLLYGAFTATVQALERMEFISLTSVVSRVFVTVVSLAALWMGSGLVAIVWIMCLGDILSLVIIVASLRRIYPFRPVFTLANVRGLLVACASFMLLGICINLNQQVDVLVISRIVNEKGVGWYGVAARLTGSLMFIPTVFMTVFFPAFSRLNKESPEQMVMLFRKAFDVMLVMGVGICTGLAVIAEPLVRLLYGPEFAPSGPILALRSLVSILTFMNILLGGYLMSNDRQKSLIGVMTVATLATIPLDLILVPLCERLAGNGALGGAWSYVVTETIILAASIRLAPQGTFTRTSLWFGFKALLAGGLMAASIWWLRDMFIGLPIVVGAVVFVALIFILKLISADEWVFIRGAFKNVFTRFQQRSVNRVTEI